MRITRRTITFLTHFSLLIGTLLLTPGQAQVISEVKPLDITLLNAQWNQEEKVPEVDSLFWQAATVQKYRHAIEYYYDYDSLRGYTLHMRELVHKLIRLNTQQGVAAYSQLRIPISGKLAYWQARTWLPDGTKRKIPEDAYHIVEPPNSPKEAIFAFRGVEQGGKVEFMYVLERPAQVSGIFGLQTQIPVQDAIFEFITPDYIKLDILTKNAPEATMVFSSKHIKNRNVWRISAQNIEPLNEVQRYRKADHKLICYRIAENERDRTTVLAWQDIGSSYSAVIYPQLSDSLKALLQEEMRAAFAELEEGAEEEAKIRALIDHVRRDFRYVQGHQSRAVSDLSLVLTNRMTNWKGLLRLYGALFWEAGIRHQPVLTSDKRQLAMDINFPSWDFIQRILFYFPEQKRFFSPLQPEYHYGLLPPETVSNRALFLNPTGTHSLFWTNVGPIPHRYQIENHTKAFYRVELDVEEHRVYLSGKRTLKGYKAIHPQEDPLFSKESPEALAAKNRLAIERLEYEEEKQDEWMQEQTGTWRSTGLLERAGKTLLLRVGDLLQLSTRTAPSGTDCQREEEIYLDYPEGYRTEIELVIPEGYLIRNLEALRHKLVYEKNGLRMGMQCTYDLEEGKVRIAMHEFYEQSAYPADASCAFWEIQQAVWRLKNTVLILEAH